MIRHRFVWYILWGLLLIVISTPAIFIGWNLLPPFQPLPISETMAKESPTEPLDMGTIPPSGSTPIPEPPTNIPVTIHAPAPTSTLRVTITPISSSALKPIAFQKGVALPAWWHDHYCDSNLGLEAIEHIAELGADSIQLVPTWYMQDSHANEVIRLEDQTASDECLLLAIEEAHRADLLVMLKPHIDIIEANIFRGEIAPSQPDDWFASYEQMIFHYVSMATEKDVELFVIGTELKSMSGQHHTDKWRSLIAQVRQQYFNRLTYAANWDEYEQVAFWDLLDYIGIDAYYPLSDLDNPSRQAILAGWQTFPYQDYEREWVKELELFIQSVEKPLIFTEIGYTSQDGAARQPWSQANSQQPNSVLQAQLYDAAMHTFWDKSYFAGLYWWFWDIHPDARFEEIGYTPKTDARQEIQHWYAFDPPEMPPTPTGFSIPLDTSSSRSLPQSYHWENCTSEAWVAQTFQDSQGIVSVEGSGDFALSGSCSLKLNAHLQGQHSGLSKGETFINQSRPFAFTGETITCWVYVPNNEAQGPSESPNGLQIFVKDSNFRSQYGAWHNLDQTGWISVSLTPSTVRPAGGYIDTGFDPGDVIIIGVKIGTGGETSGDYSYSGPFYIDNCTW